MNKGTKPKRSSQDAELGGSGLEREAVNWLRLALKGLVEVSLEVAR